MKTIKNLFLLLPLLGTACSGGPKAEEYFSAYRTVGEGFASVEAFTVSSSSTSVHVAFVDKEGADLKINNDSTPFAYTLAVDDIGAKNFDDASISFKMAESTNGRNKIKFEGAYLQKMSGIAIKSGSFGCSVDAYVTQGNAYLDFKQSGTIRSLVSSLLKEEGYPSLPGNQVKMTLGAEAKTKVDDYLPITQYVGDLTSSRYELFVDLYGTYPEGFSFLTEEKTKTISFACSDKAKAKSIVKSLVKEEKVWEKLDPAFDYASHLSLDYSVSFDDAHLLTSSFAVVLSGFDKAAIEKNNPNLKLFPSGEWRLGAKLDFGYPQGKATGFPDFSAYKDYELKKTEGN